MSPLNRRDALKGIAAAGTLRLLPSFGNFAAGQCPNPSTLCPAPTTPVVNLVFHGLFVFVQDIAKSQYVAYAPNMYNKHRYLAGTWVAQCLEDLTDLDGAYSFTGLPCGACADPDFSVNVIAQKTQIDTNKIKYFVTLPFPTRILSLRAFPYISFDDPQPNTHKIASIQIFQYGSVQISNLGFPSGLPKWAPNPSVKYYNLHFFAEPDSCTTPRELPNDPHFNHLGDVFMGFPYKMTPGGGAVSPPPSLPSAVGFKNKEFRSLGEAVWSIDYGCVSNCNPAKKKPLFPFDGHAGNCVSVYLK